MKHFLMEDMSMEELKDLVRRLRRKNDNGWLRLLIVALSVVAVVGIVAGVIMKLKGCCDGGCCCDDECECDEDDHDENGCQCANDDDFVE